jgi:outer membrane protein
MERRNKMVGKKLAMVIGIIILGWFGSVLATDLKIASVDIQKAVNECNAGKEAKKTIQKEMEKLQRQFQDKQKELQTMKETLDKQSPMLTQEARTNKEKEFQTKVRDYQRWLEDNQKDIQQKGAEMERNILMGLQKVIQKLGADEGYTLIFEGNSLPYVSKALDITDRVIKAYDVQKK